MVEIKLMEEKMVEKERKRDKTNIQRDTQNGIARCNHTRNIISCHDDIKNSNILLLTPIIFYLQYELDCFKNRNGQTNGYRCGMGSGAGVQGIIIVSSYEPNKIKPLFLLLLSIR